MKVRLGDICEVFTDGDWIESKDQSVSGIRLIQTGNIGNGEFLNKTAKKRYISKMTFNNLKCTEVFAGDILISRLPDPIGRCCIVPELPERAITAVDCTICRVKESIADLNYLCCFLQSPKYFSQLKVKITGTTRKRISRKNLGEIQVSLPSLEEQKKIASNIYQITHLMNIRKKEYALLDQLVKSRFIETFGDIHHEEKFKGIELGDICKTVSGGTPSSKYAQYFNGTIPWITTTALGPNHIGKQAARIFITNEAVMSSATHLIPPNSVLVGTRVGVGKTSVTDVSICTNQDIVALTDIDVKRYNSIFIKYSIDQYQNYFNKIKKGATILGIATQDLKQILIPIVKIEIQNEFAAFVEKVDKSKLAVKQSLEKLETLKKSLMQQYFG